MDFNHVAEVIDRNGRTRLARVATCYHCPNDKFYIMLVGEHQHIQCTECGTSYCDGSCSEE